MAIQADQKLLFRVFGTANCITGSKLTQTLCEIFWSRTQTSPIHLMDRSISRTCRRPMLPYVQSTHGWWATRCLMSTKRVYGAKLRSLHYRKQETWVVRLIQWVSSPHGKPLKRSTMLIQMKIDACDENLSGCLKPPYWERSGTKMLLREVLSISNTTELGERQTSSCPLCATLPNKCYTPEEQGSVFADIDKLW